MVAVNGCLRVYHSFSITRVHRFAYPPRTLAYDQIQFYQYRFLRHDYCKQFDFLDDPKAECITWTSLFNTPELVFPKSLT